MNNQTPVSVSAVPFNPQTQSFTPEKPTPAIAPATPNIPNLPTPNPTIAADNLGVQKVDIPGTTQVSVKSYRDNPDGTTTNFLSDGTTSTVRYTKNADGSLTPTEVNAPVNQAEEIIQKTAQQETEAQKTDRSLSKILFDIAPNLQGQAAEQALQEKRLGRDEKLLQLNALSNEIRMKDAELRQDEIKLAQGIQNIEDKPIAMEFITGQQQSVARNAQLSRALKLSERDMLNARAIGLQGDIALAESMAKKAVETKYAPWKELMETIRMQQEALKPTLAADEKKQLREQEIKTKLAFNDIKKREENETQSNQMLVQAIAQGAPQAVTGKAQELINRGADYTEVANSLGMYAGDYWATKAKIAQYNKTISASSGGGAGAVGMIPGQSVAQAYLDQFNAGALELGDIYTKIGSSKDAQKIKNEFAQLVAAQGGKRVLTMDDDQIAAIDAQIKNVNDLIGGSGYNYKVISGISQGGALGIGGRITGAKGDALSIAENLIANQTLQSLADAKAKGITFGALSGPELNAVASAASRVASKAIVDKETGKLTGFSGSETGLKKDLETIKEGLEKSKTKKTGSTQIGGKVDAAINILNQPDAQLGGYQFNN